MEDAIRTATCVIFAAMAGVCLIGGVAVLTTQSKPTKE